RSMMVRRSDMAVQSMKRTPIGNAARIARVCLSGCAPGARSYSPRRMSATPLRIVLKFGSGILANARGTTLDDRQIRRLCAEVAAVVQAGHQCVVVSSGAVA